MAGLGNRHCASCIGTFRSLFGRIAVRSTRGGLFLPMQRGLSVSLSLFSDWIRGRGRV